MTVTCVTEALAQLNLDVGEKSKDDLLNRIDFNTDDKEPMPEFDGTTVLCRVCGDKASGFHYGVHSCEGCKGFFRRSIQQKIQYRPCTKNQQCTIQRVNRNRCQYCRLKKCIAVGMSRDAVRFGRVPKREKARIFAAMQSVNASRCVANNVVSELDDEKRVTQCVIQNYMDSCEYTQDRIHVLYEQARGLPVYTHCSQYESCPLSPRAVNASHDSQEPKEFGEHFSTSIRGVIEFSRRLPGFCHLPHEDQVTLLKSSAFEALLVRLAALFNIQSDVLLSMNGRLLKREAVYSASNSKFLMDSMCDFADRLNRLGLSDPELALFSAVIVMSSDRPGIRNRDLVERMHNKYASFLQNMLARNHPNMPSLYRDLLSYIPDLRTLNTLHSDKLMRQRRPIPEMAASVQWEEPRSMWDEKDGNMGSPTSSCNTEESMRSPESYSDSVYGECVSSEGSVCGSEVAGYLDPRPTYPQHRRRCDNSEGTSSGDEMSEMTKCPYSKRKVDSPEDSGIESDKISLPSICSSPRSSIDEKSEEDREEDMPVLRRALQAPPILNNDVRMDETYKRHKKFRALRREDEPHSSQTSMPSPTSSILAQTLVQPISHISIQSSSASSSSPSLLASVLSSPSLAKTLSEQPKMSEISLRKADLLHAIMVKNETSQRNQRLQHQQSPRVSPAPLYIPSSCMERLQVSPSNNWSSSTHIHSASSNQQPIMSQPRVHLLTTPTPSRYYEPRISASSSSPSRHSPSSFQTSSPHSHGASQSPVIAVTVDIADSQQPLNLSTKTPPPQEFMIEA